MNPLRVIYWTRSLLGVAAGLICAFLSGLSWDFSILNGVSVALLIYIVTYYIYKARFVAKVEKASKIFSTGVGAYFLTWIVIFGFFFTLITPILTIADPAPGTVFSPGDKVVLTAKIANQLGSSVSGAIVTTKSPADVSIDFMENSPGTYSASYNITSSDPAGEWKIKVEATINGRHLETSISVVIQSGS